MAVACNRRSPKFSTRNIKNDPRAPEFYRCSQVVAKFIRSIHLTCGAHTRNAHLRSSSTSIPADHTAACSKYSSGSSPPRRPLSRQQVPPNVPRASGTFRTPTSSTGQQEQTATPPPAARGFPPPPPPLPPLSRRTAAATTATDRSDGGSTTLVTGVGATAGGATAAARPPPAAVVSGGGGARGAAGRRGKHRRGGGRRPGARRRLPPPTGRREPPPRRASRVLSPPRRCSLFQLPARSVDGGAAPPPPSPPPTRLPLPVSGGGRARWEVSRCAPNAATASGAPAVDGGEGRGTLRHDRLVGCAGVPRRIGITRRRRHAPRGE